MRLASLLLVLGTCAATTVAQSPAPKNHLVLVGGGEKLAVAMKKFVELAGGQQALIVAIPTASEEADTGAYYIKLFKEEHGCANVVSLDIKTKEDAMRPEYAEVAARARGIFFAGGDQNRITRALLDTPVGKAIEDAFADGAVIGGTSAGTACQSQLMITGEGDFKTIKANTVELARGLGFFRGVIVDQHFVARQRSNRLISVIIEHPELLGVGVDEDTAIWVRPDNTFQVLGERSVAVLDASGATVTRAPGEKGQDLLGVNNLRVHVLLPGQSFSIVARATITERATPATATSK